MSKIRNAKVTETDTRPGKFLAIDGQGQISSIYWRWREWAALGEGIFLFVP